MCDSYPSAYRERIVIARLPHRCYSCGFAIMPGETYRHASGVWDGRPDDFKRHLLCAVLEEQTGEHDGCWTFGALREARDLDDRSWAFRRAWSVVMRQEWDGCEDCGDPLPYPSPAFRCGSCLLSLLTVREDVLTAPREDC